MKRNFIVVPIIALLIFSLQTKVNAQATPNSECNSSLWNHVYSPIRFSVFDSCFIVTGTVKSAWTETDGDMHIRLTVDPQFDTMINSYNKSGEAGCLVLEPICDTTPTYSPAITPCSGFVNTVYIPAAGEYVYVQGSYVNDGVHGWNEIHPVTKIWIVTAVANVSAPPTHVDVFPNPATDEVTFKTSEQPASTIFVTIMNTLGRACGRYQFYAMSELKVNTSLMPDGVYYYHIVQNDKEVQTGAFVVKNR